MHRHSDRQTHAETHRRTSPHNNHADKLAAIMALARPSGRRTHAIHDTNLNSQEYKDFSKVCCQNVKQKNKIRNDNNV